MRQLAYSRVNPSAEFFDKRSFGNAYTGDRNIKIFGRVILPDLESARKRMVVVNGRMVHYTPSPAFFRCANKLQPKPKTLTKLNF